MSIQDRLHRAEERIRVYNDPVTRDSTLALIDQLIAEASSESEYAEERVSQLESEVADEQTTVSELTKELSLANAKLRAIGDLL